MTRLLTILFVALICEGIGVVFLSRGLKEIGEVKQMSVAEVGQLVLRGVTNSHIVRGVFFEALFFVGLLMLMSKADVSFVWPLTSLSFVVTTIAAKIYLHEQISPARWFGVCLIMLGAALITATEKRKIPPAAPAAIVQSSPAGLISPQ